METKTRVSTAITRRALVAAGAGVVLGAVGLLLPAARDEAAAERPHERLQDRTPQRNRRQRNDNDNDKNQNNKNDRERPERPERPERHERRGSHPGPVY